MATTSPAGRRPSGGSSTAARRRAATSRRPAGAAEVVGPAPSERRPSLTGRAAILAFVVGALALTLALPVREFFAQRAVLDSLAERTSASAAKVAELQAEKQRWLDPSFVRAQARERLHFVMPGEVGYVVLDPAEDGAGTAPAAGGDATALSWYARLWGSVEEAGSTQAPAPAPAPSVRPGAPR